MKKHRILQRTTLAAGTPTSAPWRRAAVRLGGFFAWIMASAAGAASYTATVNIDANADRHPISPLIYGIDTGGKATQADLSDLNVPVHRLGGNRTSRYNWQANADVTARDWYFESYPGTSATPGAIVDSFVGTSKSAGAEPMVTVPMLDWIAKLGTNRSVLCSFSVSKYGAQQGSDSWYPDCGNGVRTDGSYVTGNSPADAGLPSDPSVQQGLVDHLVATWGVADSGGVHYYTLDNEPSIWFDTHRDVHPVGARYEEVRDKMIGFGGMIKSADPNAWVMGPEEWGWSGYFWSGYDQQVCAKTGCWSSSPDQVAHGGQKYMDWLLDQLKIHQDATGQRVLDVFTLHYYPQGGEYGTSTTTTTQNLRNRSTRSLWDPTYQDESWIGDKVRLIPRMRDWVNQHYPGTKIGITEYSWGADGHINGATAQADILGIFGREGLDLATRWGGPQNAGNPIGKAFKMYRNYDGAKSTFGDISVRAAASVASDRLAAYAAQRSAGGKLTVMVINKHLSNTASVTLNLANFVPTSTAVERWQLTKTNAIQHLANAALSGSTLKTSLPPQSITLLLIR